MKIDSSHPLTRPTQGEASVHKPAAPGANAGKTATPASMTHLSRPAGGAGGDIDTARVEELRQAISEGRLEIHPERIADGLIDSIRDLLDSDTGSRT